LPGGLSLIGAVVAEIAAGSAGAGSGLAYRIANPLPPQHSPNVRGVAVALGRRDCNYGLLALTSHLVLRRLARERAWKGKLMVGGNISSEKIDLLIYGPSKPIVDNGFSDQFVLALFRDHP